jgi:hypothetical protein
LYASSQAFIIISSSILNLRKNQFEHDCAFFSVINAVWKKVLIGKKIIDIYANIHLLSYIYMNVYIYSYIHICMYTYIHTYIHIYNQNNVIRIIYFFLVSNEEFPECPLPNLNHKIRLASFTSQCLFQSGRKL